MASPLTTDADSIEEICNTILHNEELNKPYVFEDVFIRDVIPLLVRPWDPNNLTKYIKYVKELTNELRIISREVDAKVIHVVPAMYPRPVTTMPETNAATAGNLAQHLQLQRLRSPLPQDHIMTDFLLAIASGDPVEDSVLKPLARILAHYGRALEDDDGTPLYRLEGEFKTVSTLEEFKEVESSYSDEYDD